MPQSPKANRGPSVGPQNRRALIDAAREVFAAEGLSAPLSSVAKRAGVGQGSLYRHFPDRTALAVAVFDENIAELEALAERPETILDDLLEHVIEQALVSTAIITFLTANPDDERVIPLGDRFRHVAERLIARERTAGRLGDHVAAEDVLLAVSMLAGILSRTPAGERRATAKRAWGLFHAAFAPR
ncbi:DNA-binding transcriptional regulator, AcrR family [Paramicrobacterium humi]|uniref:DNA-binding transcriptional regulator, AcrR family n=1 Tax=Paramicrobacterium humi TaxID=640635 RepID=A0A1H4KTR6_9MICO|nr:TetR/AcrR family transcriptional regulator [Microbacterium humi]SEB61606.1 DNA-binding transcriptional regulator, AcrR family [Microbacterium humi]